jgi:hypothetical protein
MERCEIVVIFMKTVPEGNTGLGGGTRMENIEVEEK